MWGLSPDLGGPDPTLLKSHFHTFVPELAQGPPWRSPPEESFSSVGPSGRPGEGAARVPSPRDPPEDVREDPAAAGLEDKPPPLPKGNPWTKKLPQHLSPVGTGVPPPAQDSPEAGECDPREVFGS